VCAVIRKRKTNESERTQEAYKFLKTYNMKTHKYDVYGKYVANKLLYAFVP
jgi:hypothetical protein